MDNASFLMLTVDPKEEKERGIEHFGRKSLILIMNEPFTKGALHLKDDWQFYEFSSFQDENLRELCDKTDTVHFISVFFGPNYDTCVVSMTQTKDNEWMLRLHRQGGAPENLINPNRASLCKVRPVRN